MHMCVHACLHISSWKPENGIGSHGTAVVDGCEETDSSAGK